MSTTPPAPPPPANPYATAAPPLSAEDEKLWAVLTHIGGILFSWIVPLVTYLVFKDRGPFIRSHTATALNFQLTLLIVYLASAVLLLVFIGFLTFAVAAIGSLVLSIIAAVSAGNGQYYRYPLTITFVR